MKDMGGGWRRLGRRRAGPGGKRLGVLVEVGEAEALKGANKYQFAVTTSTTRWRIRRNVSKGGKGGEKGKKR